MGPELTPYELRMIPTRLIEDRDPHETVSEVFTTTESRNSFVRGLVHLASLKDAVIAAGGRRVRDFFYGCRTWDFADLVQFNASLIYEEFTPRHVQLFWPSQILRGLSPDRFVVPDLDFTYSNLTSNQVKTTFAELGFRTKHVVSTSGVEVIDVFGDPIKHKEDRILHPVASFVDIKKSWHHQAPWPKIGQIQANLDIKTDLAHPFFHADIGWGTLNAYPLSCPGIGIGEFSDVLKPHCFASIARALLYSFTITLPSQNPLPLPFKSERQFFYSAASFFKPLAKAIDEGSLPNPGRYSTAMREMAISFFEIGRKSDGWDKARHTDFFGIIRSNLVGGSSQTLPEGL